VTSTAGPADRRSVAFAGGAALAGPDGTWVLADADPSRALGPALAVARRLGEPGTPLQLVVDRDGGLLARRAALFADSPVVWQVDGTALVRAEPEPLAPPPAIDPRVAPFADVLARCGADPVVEHGRLVGEVLGLEVARVVVDDEGAHLQVGVGRFDREAHETVANGPPGEATLRRVVEQVRAARTPGAEHHPLKQLAAARGLRARLLAEPGLVGADHLLPLAAPVEPPDLKTPWPSPATGIGIGGEPMVVVCSVGIDLDLVPAAAEARLAAFGDAPARLVLAVPERDVHPVTVDLARLLAVPAEVVAIPSVPSS